MILPVGSPIAALLVVLRLTLRSQVQVPLTELRAEPSALAHLGLLSPNVTLDIARV